VCSHLGCPSSLYEQQTYRILCPCHNRSSTRCTSPPIFGPAARALAQLPITIDKDGLPGRQRRLHRTRRTGILGAHIMSSKLGEAMAKQGDAIDSRYHPRRPSGGI
jgi:hypothetical protein